MEKMDFKKGLRKLWFLLHPDRYSHQPEIYSTNEESFKHLNQLLDLLNEPYFSLKGKIHFDFHFYFYDESQNLKEIKTEFSFDDKEVFSVSKFKETAFGFLLNLMEMCEIEIEDNSLSDQNPMVQNLPTSYELYEWLKQNIEEVKIKAEQHKTLYETLEDLRKEVSSALGLTSLFVTISVNEQQAIECIKLMKKHIQRFKNIPKISGQRIYISTNYEISEKGYVAIPWNFEIKECLEFINCNIDKITEFKVQAEKINDELEYLKKQIASELNASYIQTSFACDETKAIYGLKKIKETISLWKQYDFKDIAIYIGDKFEIKAGILYVPWNFQLEDAKKFLNFDNIALLKKLTANEKQLRSTVEKKEKTIKKSLNLALLYYSTSISLEDYNVGLDNLLKCIPLLKELNLTNVILCVGNEYKITSYGSITIPYNFEVSELRNYMPKISDPKRIES